MLKSTNVVLDQLRTTARVLRMPQATVAANWVKSGAMGPYSPSRNRGITRAEYRAGRDVVVRLARLAS